MDNNFNKLTALTNQELFILSLLFFALMLGSFLRFASRKKLAIRCLGQAQQQPIQHELLVSQKKVIVSTKRIVKIAAKYFFLHTSCMVRAFAVAQVLKYYRIPYTFYFGISKNQEEEIIAHAWVSCADLDVVGGEEKIMFKPISCYSWPAQ